MEMWVNLMAKFVICRFRGRRELALENVALRQQLMVLQRNSKRPQFKDTDRLFWVLYSRADPNHEPSESDLGPSSHHRGVGQIGKLGLQVDGRSISDPKERDAVADVEIVSC